MKPDLPYYSTYSSTFELYPKFLISAMPWQSYQSIMSSKLSKEASWRNICSTMGYWYKSWVSHLRDWSLRQGSRKENQRLDVQKQYDGRYLSTEVDIGKHFEYELRTLSSREGEELFHIVLIAMIQDVVYSFTLQEVCTLGSASSADDGHTWHLTEPLGIVRVNLVKHNIENKWMGII